MYNCEILNMYDRDDSGRMDGVEITRAIADESRGTITQDELVCIMDAWKNGVDIAAVCPGQSTRLVTIAVAGLALLYILTR